MRHFSGEFKGVRVLLEDELEKISGGQGADTDDITTLDEVVVKPDAESGNPVYYIPVNWSFGGHSGGTYEDPEPSDEDAIHVKINFDQFF